MSAYYREKIIKLHDVLFLSGLSARETFIKNEQHFYAAYMSSKTIENQDLQNKWNEIWSDLNRTEAILIRGLDVSTFVKTIGRMRNRSLEKYSLFILEEFYRVL
ncbi:hypothetical protein [Sphingobacterium kitahiroshimense]|uniref:Uncharacterized protein n=1 Tax=Sphingobacterium kitahiroshimense TaxID=470446 RepID=A0ABV0C254_9SPHI